MKKIIIVIILIIAGNAKAAVFANPESIKCASPISFFYKKEIKTSETLMHSKMTIRYSSGYYDGAYPDKPYQTVPAGGETYQVYVGQCVTYTWGTTVCAYAKGGVANKPSLNDLGEYTALPTEATFKAALMPNGCENPCTEERAKAEETCGPNPNGYTIDAECNWSCDCDDEYQAAVTQCGGDTELVTILDNEKCQFDCQPCVAQDDKQVSEIPVGWAGVSLPQMAEKCGGLNKVYNYNADNCLGYCQQENCEQQYKELAEKCGGAEYIALGFNTTTCEGECQPCGKEEAEANARCGGAYKAGPNCTFECIGCEEKLDLCISGCGGDPNSVVFTCDEKTDQNGNRVGVIAQCDCTDPAMPGWQPPEQMPPVTELPPLPPSTTVTTINNPDGTTTTIKKETTYTPSQTYTSPDGVTLQIGGGKKEVVTTTVTDDQGSVVSTKTETKETKGEPSEESEPDEKKEYEKYTGTGEEIDFTPLEELVNLSKNRFPISLMPVITRTFSMLHGEGKAPVFVIPITYWQKQWTIDLSVLNPVAALVKVMFTMALIIFTSLGVIRFWRGGAE